MIIDDYDMAISHVIRGDDHINNTPRQINMLQALGADIPVYAHLPMILGSDGKCMSKRHGAMSVMQYRDDGFLPDALVNYLIRLGWSSGDQEMFSREEMIQRFELNAINKGAASFNLDKLLWFNQQYLKTSDAGQVAEQLAWQFDNMQIDTTSGPTLKDVVTCQAERCKTLVEMAEKSQFFYQSVDEYDAKAVKKFLTIDILPAITDMRDQFASLMDWSAPAIHDIIKNTAESYDFKLGKLAQPLRIFLTGGTVSPPIDATLELLGQSRVLERLEKGIAYIFTPKLTNKSNF